MNPVDGGLGEREAGINMKKMFKEKGMFRFVSMYACLCSCERGIESRYFKQMPSLRSIETYNRARFDKALPVIVVSVPATKPLNLIVR